MSGIIIAIVVFLFLIVCCVYAACVRHRQHTNLVKESRDENYFTDGAVDQNSSLFDIMSLQDIYHSKSFSSGSSSRLSGDSSSFSESYDEGEGGEEEEGSEGHGESIAQTESEGTHRLSKKSSKSSPRPLRYHPFSRRMSSESEARPSPASLGITIWDDELNQHEEHQLPPLNKDLDIFTFPNIYASSSDQEEMSHFETVNLHIGSSDDDEPNDENPNDLPISLPPAVTVAAVAPDFHDEEEEKSSLYTPTSLRSAGSSHGSSNSQRFASASVSSLRSKDSKNSHRRFLQTRSSSRDIIVATDPLEL
jgi:hypothetical protein